VCAAVLGATFACGGSEFSAGDDATGAGADSGGESGSGGNDGAGAGKGDGAAPSSGGNSGGSGSSVAGCDDYVRAVCEWDGRCGKGLTGSREICLALYEGSCDWYALPGSNVGAAAFAACSRSFDEADCESSVPTCELPPGTIANGMPCAASLQCESNYCNLTGECGVCGPDPQHEAGGACSSLANCKAGLECVEGECAPMREAGEACDAVHHCSIEALAEGRLACVEGVCKGVGFIGDPCFEGGCGTGAACTEETCVPYSESAPGAPCGTFADEVIGCQGGICRADDTSNLRCVAWAGPGESCHKIEGFSRCADGLACNESDICVYPEVRSPPEDCD
jgi:hypothetical protein